MYMKESIKSILKNKLFSIIIIIQLIVAFFTLAAGFLLIGDSLNKVLNFSSIFDEDKTIHLERSTEMMMCTLEDEDIDYLFNLYNELSKDENIEKMGICSIAPYNVRKIESLSEISKGQLDHMANITYIDENFYKYIGNLKLKEGRDFKDDDFNKGNSDTIPIIISSDLEEWLPLGTTFKNCEVIGILKNDNKLYYKNTGFMYSGVTQEENTILYPCNYKDRYFKKDIAYGFLGGTMITLKDESLKEEYINKITNKLKDKCNVPIVVSGVKQHKAEYIDSIKTGIVAIFALSGMLLIFSFLGIMGIILSWLIRRKKEFGIKLSLGWTYKDICFQVMAEILVFTTTASLIAFLLSFILVKFNGFSINIYIYIIEGLLILIISCIYSIIPIYKIKKMNIVELIKDVR